MLPVLSSGTRLLVLGGSGFIGSHLPAALAEIGVEMGVYDLYPIEYLVPAGVNVRYHEGDIRDFDNLSQVMQDYDAVLNLAAAHHDFGLTEETFYSVNVHGAEVICAAMDAAGITNLCFYSSVAVYGEHPRRPGEIPDESTVPNPTNTYGKTKLAAEGVYRKWQAAGEDRRVLIMRPAVVFGPRNVANVFRLIDQIARHQFYPVGEGENVKSMVYVENIVAAIIQLWQQQPHYPAENEFYNYVDTPDMPSREIIATIYAELGRKAPAHPLPLAPIIWAAKPFDLLAAVSGRDLPITSERVRKLSRANTLFAANRIKAVFTAPKTLKEGLREMVSWYLATPAAERPQPHKPPAKIRYRADFSPLDKREKVIAVVVTFNREHLVGACLDALAAQTRPLDGVIVINNASTDKSGEIARRHPLAPQVIDLHRNVGGAGGFAAGMAIALNQLSPDWIWLMDDDTVATPTALAELLQADREYPDHLSVLSSKAVWTNGEEHPMNTSRVRVGVPKAKVAALAQAGLRPIRTASYVSCLLNAADVRKAGLPFADYFIWSDDFEHTGRLLKQSQGLRVSASVVEHRTKLFKAARQDPGARFYYDVRNKLWALLFTRSFTWWEVMLYGGRTALAWVSVLLRSRGKRMDLALRGLKDAVTTSPRQSWQVLDADPLVAAEIRKVDDGTKL